MDFTLSPEQGMIAASVTRFVAEAPTLEARAETARTPRGFRTERWATFSDLGWLALGVSEEFGGFGGSAVDAMIVMEGIGASMELGPFAASAIVASAALATPNASAAVRAILDTLTDGSAIAALAYAEPGSGFDPGRVETVARGDGDTVFLTGEKIAVPYGGACNVYVVSAVDAASGEVVLAVVDADAPGIERGDLVTFDERRMSSLRLDDVRIAADRVIPNAASALDEAIDRGVAAVCAEAVGIMVALHERTVDHLKTRIQFGRPIGSFQVLQHRAVDMLIACELARSSALVAAAAIDDGATGAAERRTSVAAARLQIAESGRYVAEQAIQLHGAMGLTEEFAIGAYAKRLLMIASEYGSDDLFLERLTWINADRGAAAVPRSPVAV